MADDRNTILTHVYGVAGLVPGIVTIIFLIVANSSWREYALVGSGWVAAAFYAFMLFRVFEQGRTDGRRIGTLTQKVRGLEAKLADREAELSARNKLLDYLGGLLMAAPAQPRAAPSSPAEGQENG